MIQKLSDNVLKICTFNCNGLNNAGKRKDLFDFMRNKNWNIILLQESHLLTKDENYIRSNWGYELILCGVDTNKNGVAILFNNNFEYKVLDVKRDPLGCYVALSIEFLKKKYTLINVYGPSCGDKPDFFDNICDCIDFFQNDLIIVGGDWNCYLDKNLDTRNYASSASRPNSRKKILEIMSTYELYDVFREMYPEERKYTWRRFNSVKQSRLDYFLVSEALLNDIYDVCIDPGYRSDHSFVVLSLNKECLVRDRPFWKFNNGLLKDMDYVQEIKKIISDVKKQYAVPVYNFDCLDSVNDQLLSFQISDQLFLETLLMEIRGKTISYATFKKKERGS